MIESTILALLHKLDPELAHGLALRALDFGLAPRPACFTSPRLETQIAGLDLRNPLGLAAGLDKNAVAVPALGEMGFGFLEVGAATPQAQPGNPRPRLFRLSEDRAIINRFGFNNDGVDAIAQRLAMNAATCPVGLNLGANKASVDKSSDYARVLSVAGPFIDFATVNVSSPNTEALQLLQNRQALSGLLTKVANTNSRLTTSIPIFLKIAPDISQDEITDIAQTARTHRVAAIIATNTTRARDGLRNAQRVETGGLSGAPLFGISTQVLARLYLALDGAIPLIGVGGVGNAEQAYQKIRAGASALQIYSALIYQGFGCIPIILRGLDALLARDGFSNVAEAVGIDAERYAGATTG